MIRISPSLDSFSIDFTADPKLVEAVEEVQNTQEAKKTKGPSPMSLFEERERSSTHLSQKALVTPEAQKGNGWYNPFTKFYSWVVQSIWGEKAEAGADPSGLSEEDHKKVRVYCQEVRTAMAALDDLIANDEEVKESFDQLMLLIQRQKEDLHKKIVIQQGEAFHRAHKEVKNVQADIKKETEAYLHKLSRNGVLAKVSAIITPLTGLFVSTFAGFTGDPQADIVIRPVIFVLSALSAANVVADDPFLNDNVSFISELSIGASTSLAEANKLSGMMGVAVLLSQAMGRVTQSYIRYSDGAFRGTMAVEDNKKRLAEEKFNDLGDKAQAETGKYLKGIGQLAEMLGANLELIKALWRK